MTRNEYLVGLVKSDIDYHEYALNVLLTEDVTHISEEDKERWVLQHSADIVYAKEVLRSLYVS